MSPPLRPRISMFRRTIPTLFCALALSLSPAVHAQEASGQNPVRMESIPTFSGGMMGGSGPFTLISLRDGRVVVAPEATGAARADSASASWDLGLRGTEVILNGGASGPGGIRGILAQRPYDTVTEVPDSLSTDGEGACTRGPARVVCSGSGNGWYQYAAGAVSPIPERTLVIERPDGSALKVRFVRYELGLAIPGGPSVRYVTLEAEPLPTE